MARMASFVRMVLGQMDELADAIDRVHPDAVLNASFAEYFSPLWAWKLRRRRGRVRFGAVVHDPVRDYRIGPQAWHRWSVRAAYSCLDAAFIHEETDLETCGRFPNLQVTVIPHGLYDFTTERPPRNEARKSLDLPPDAPVFLSFGHIRDGKNLDLFISTMTKFPNAHLIVAGIEQSSGQRPARFYMDLAEKLRVQGRIRWSVRHIPEAEIGRYFEASDYILLTYSSHFRSASGVLAAAAQFQRPVLASSGDGPLKVAVNRYSLGRFVEPDNTHALVEGVSQLMDSKTPADWEGFRRDHSWETNARIVTQCLGRAPDVGN